MRNIGDVNAEEPAAAAFLKRDRVIEVLRVRAVYRKDDLVAQIEPPVRRQLFRRTRFGFRDHIVGEGNVYPAVAQDRFVVCAEALRGTEIGYDFSAKCQLWHIRI